MTVQTTILAAVRTILDDPDADVRWYDRTAEWVNDDLHVEIRVLGIPRFGEDERRYSDTAEELPYALPAVLPGAVLRERIYGNRSLRLQFTCNTNDQDLLSSGQEIAETLIAGFMRTDIEDALAVEDLGVPRSQGVRVANAPDAHGDERSIAIFELWFPWSRSQAGGTIGTIGSVVYAGDIEGAADIGGTVDDA